jgi:CRP/FNR family transcriptional regulator, cyclic AMP receptor protein
MSWSKGKNEDDFSSSEFQENVIILRQINFFSSLPLDALKLLAYMCQRENFKKGDVLFSQDDDDGQAFYLISGTAQLVREEKSENYEIKRFQSGDFLSGLALLGDLRRRFSLIALDDLSALILTRENFDLARAQFPDILVKIVKAVVYDINLWEERMLVDHDASCPVCCNKIGVSLV